MVDFYKYLNAVSPISKQNFLLIEKLCLPQKYPKKTILCNIGKIPTNIYFIKSGYIRAYTLGSTEKQYTKSLFKANQFAASISGLITKKPSKLVYEAITDCEVFKINYNSFRDLAKKNIEIANIALKMHDVFYISMENKLFEFTTKDATARYLSILKRFNGIENLIPQYQIATILGITPIQLSRIRKKVNS